MRFALTLLALAIGCLAATGSPAPAFGAEFSVTSTTDAVDANPGDGVCASAAGECTLRAAIQETNALPGADFVYLNTETVTLTIAGEGEDVAATGDLDIADDLTLVSGVACPAVGGACPRPVVDARGVDRVFDIAQGASATIAGIEIRGGSAMSLQSGTHGGGIRNGGSLTLASVLITANTALAGGGVENLGSTSLENVEISDNEAPVYAGGFLNEDTGSANLKYSSIRNNRVSTGDGGGLTNLGTITVDSTAITGNTASRFGGGIENYAGRLATLVNSTISGNSAQTGGGLFNRGPGAGAQSLGLPPPPPGVTSLANVTIAENVAQQAEAIMNQGTVTSVNSILSGVDGSADCDAPITSLGHNLATDSSCGLGKEGDIQNADPKLAPLASGSDLVFHALLAGSPAIDGGSNAECQATDQRGAPRPQDGNGDGMAICDIGSYELLAPIPASPTPSPSPTPGALPDTGGQEGSPPVWPLQVLAAALISVVILGIAAPGFRRIL
jgi:CSLREA domain-containing protein